MILVTMTAVKVSTVQLLTLVQRRRNCERRGNQNVRQGKRVHRELDETGYRSHIGHRPVHSKQ